MSNDPYGYADEAPRGPADLSRVLWYGVGALICAAIGPCLCYLPYLAAIPLGWMAIQQSKAARASAVPLERTVGNVAQTSGIIGLAFGVLAILGVTLYALFLGGALALGALGDTFEDVERDLTEPVTAEPVPEGSLDGEEGGVMGGEEEGAPDLPIPPPDMLQE